MTDAKAAGLPAMRRRRHQRRPGREGVQALVGWQSRRGGRPCIDGLRYADLFDVARARPRITVTSARAAPLHAVMAAMRTCPSCGTDRGYVLSARIGKCNDCASAAGEL